MPPEPIGELFRYSGNAVAFDAEASKVFWHYDRHTGVRIVGLVKLAAKRASLDTYARATEIGECLDSPPLGQAINDLDVFMAGEAEVDEPLAVEHPRRLLQQHDPLPVILDEVVIGGEDRDHPLLGL
jgi:hypothetical protein